MKFKLFFLIVIFFLFSCRKDQPPIKENPVTTPQPATQRVFICNEGNFMFNNASISLYYPNTSTSIDDIYKTNNNNQSLGDVCQSVCKYKSTLYAVLNNSGKIRCLDEQTFKEKASINGLTSPRYFLPVSNDKAYVSDLYSNSLTVIDLNSNQIKGRIPCMGWTEEMTSVSGKVFVCNLNSHFLYVVDSFTDKISDSIHVGYGSRSIVKDKNSKLWVLCSGDSISKSMPQLVRINPYTHQIENNIRFTDYSQSPSTLKINDAGDVLYYINKHVYKMSVNDNQLPNEYFINGTGRLFYSMGINPIDESVYLTDAIDYVQRGKVLIYSKNGNFQKQFTAGTIPGYLLFD